MIKPKNNVVFEQNNAIYTHYKNKPPTNLAKLVWRNVTSLPLPPASFNQWGEVQLASMSEGVVPYYVTTFFFSLILDTCCINVKFGKTHW